jgi:hypothetical protein
VTSKKIRVAGSKDINKAKAILISAAYKRAKRAISAGFYIEAIAIEESLICDRLEAMLSRELRKDIEISTIGRLLQQLAPFDVIPEALVAELTMWQRHRSQVIHQIVKVTQSDDMNWRKRIAFANQISRDGLALFSQLKALEVKHIRSKKKNV